MGDPVAAVGEVDPVLRLPVDRDLVGRPARLDRKSAAGALLAVEAMARRHPHRLAGGRGAQLPTAARGASGGHFAAFLSARRTSASSWASGPSSSWAAATA